ncbi:MAG: DUF6351 family protein, partial [Colwellia sp.]
EFPELNAAQSKPAQLQDTCFDDQGGVLATGKDVWHGNWKEVGDGKKALKRGVCAEHYAIFSNSRIQAEGPWQGSVFKCYKIPFEQAIKQGMYAGINLAEQLTSLRAIFSQGVCDYSQGDAGRPSDL